MGESGPGSLDDEGLTLRGSIEDTSVPELLKSVLGSGETGVLTFRRADVTKNVHLHLGRIVYARSSNPDERMGEDLLLRGKITARQYLEASRLIAPGRRLGKILVELGALEPEDLLGSIEHHVKEILLEMFTWSRGEYELTMTEPGKDDVALNLSTEALIMDGLRRVRSWHAVYRGIGGDLDAVPVPTGTPGDAAASSSSARRSRSSWRRSTATRRSSRSARSRTCRTSRPAGCCGR